MKKHYKDYKLVMEKLPNGKVKQITEYIGKYYICQLNETDFIRFKLYYLTLVLCSGATAIGVGFLGSPGDRVAYVALPYVSLYLPMVYSLLGTIGFISSDKRLEQATYDKTKIRIFRSTIWQMVLSSLAGLGNIMFTLFRDDLSFWKNWLFTGCMLLILVLNTIFLQFQKRVTYKVEDPNYNV